MQNSDVKFDRFVQRSGMRLVAAFCLCLLFWAGGCSSIRDLEYKAGRGDIEAQLELAAYYRSRGDRAGELRFLKMAADEKYPAAVRDLARLYQEEKIFDNASYWHIIYFNITEDPSLAESWLDALLSGKSFRELAAAIPLAEALISRQSDRANIAANIRKLTPLRNAVERFIQNSRSKGEFRNSFELQRDFNALTEKFPGLKALVLHTADGDDQLGQPPSQPREVSSRSGSAAVAEKASPVKTEKTAALQRSVSKTPAPAETEKTAAVQRSVSNTPVPVKKERAAVAAEEKKELLPPCESAAYVRQNWRRFTELTASGVPYGKLRLRIASGAKGFYEHEEEWELIVKCRYNEFSVRYFFLKNKVNGKKDSASLCKIEVIPSAQKYSLFRKHLDGTFRQVPPRSVLPQLRNNLWACEFRLSASVRTLSEQNVFISLCERARLSEFQIIRPQTPQYESWLDNLRKKVNSRGYIEVSRPGAIEYYLPGDCYKWFAVTPRNQSRVSEQICNSDEAAGKIVFSRINI